MAFLIFSLSLNKNTRKYKFLHLSVSWIINCMRKADKNEDNKMTLKELKHFLRQINVEVDDMYAEDIFKVKHRYLKICVLSVNYVVVQLIHPRVF